MVLVRLLVAFVRLLFLPLARLRFRRAVRPGTYLTLEVDGPVRELAPPRGFFLRPVRNVVVLGGLRQAIATAVNDARVRGIVVVLKSVRTGMAGATALRSALDAARAGGKEVVVHLPLGGGTKEFYVASAASTLLGGPQATMAPVGFSTTVRYLRRALDRANIEPEVIARGRYKSAGEQLVLDRMSEPQREQLDALLSTIYAEVENKLAEGRRVDTARARALIDDAPYRAERAVAVGLLDGACYEDEVHERLGGAETPIVPLSRYAAAARACRLPRVRPPDVIGVVEVHGPIMHASGIAMALGDGAIDERVIGAIRRARTSRRVRAVIVHIDSPGGGALASDRIHHELVRLASDKPVIACMGNVAASGGYYVAVAARSIVAQPTTTTGSIGVVAARLVLDPLLDRLGVVTERVYRGAHAGMLDAFRRLDGAEREALEREIGGMYDAFVAIVAAGRRRDEASIRALAEGRVYSGAHAHAVGLVDHLGGFDTALTLAREAIGPAGRDLEPVVIKPPRTPTSSIEPAERKAAELVAALAVLPGLERVGALCAPLAPLALLASRERVLAYAPAAAAWQGGEL
jgi:protease-4